MKLRIFFFFVAGLLPISAGILQAQIPEADSLKHVLKSLQQRHSPSDTVVIDCLNNIAYSMRNNAHDSALVYAHEAQLRSLQIGYARGQALALLIQGVVSIYAGHYHAGLEMHLQAFDLYTGLRDTVFLGYVLNNIGFLYKAQGKYDMAQDYFLRSEAFFRSMRYNTGLSLVWGNLGDIALQRGDIREALRFEHQSLHYARVAKDIYNEGVAQYHLSQIFLAEKRYDSAHSYQKRALQLFIKDSNTTYIIRSFDNLAAIYAAQGQFENAFQAARRGFKYAEASQSPVSLVQMNERLGRLYEAMGNFPLALAYFRRTTSLRDSLSALNIEQRIKVLDMMREAEKSQKELLLAAQEQERLVFMRNSLIAGLGIAVLLLVLAIHRYRYIARSEQTLRDVNAVIVKQQEQLQEQSTRIQAANDELEHINEELDSKNIRLQAINTRLEEANVRLAGLNHEKDELLGIVAHDLKNPLTSIMLASSSLRAEALAGLQRLTPQRVDALTMRIASSSERMMNIITKLLRSSRLDEEGTIMEIQPVDVISILQAILESHRQQAERKRISIHTDFHNLPDTQTQVLADPDAVTEVFENLIDNAIKYSPFERNVFVRVRLSNTNTTHKVCCEIQDEGPGFSDEDKQHLFTKFARLSAQPTGGEDSTGLGLNIVKKLVEAMQGKVWCESEIGKGAIFFVELPIAESLPTNQTSSKC